MPITARRSSAPYGGRTPTKPKLQTSSSISTSCALSTPTGAPSPSPQSSQPPQIQHITEPAEVGSWHLTRHTLSPSVQRLHALSDMLAKLDEDDVLVEFVFPGSHSVHAERDTLFAHRSRLHFVGGPLMTLQPSACKHGKRCTLCLERQDTRQDFLFVKRFLYCQNLDLCDLDVAGLTSLSFTAHRWGLPDLFWSILLYLEKYNMLDDPRVILDAAPLLRLRLTPPLFKKYFCLQVCSKLDSIAQVLSDEEAEARSAGDVWLPSSPFNTESRSIWETLFAENLLPFLFHRLSAADKRKNQNYLVHAVMRHLEPVVQNDETLIALLLQLGWHEHDAGAGAYGKEEWIRTWSIRALQLSARAMRSPVARGISVTIPCRVRVADMSRGGRMIVRSRRYSVGSTMCYLSCGREVLPQGDVWGKDIDRGRRLFQGISLYLHLERGSSRADLVDDDTDAALTVPSSEAGPQGGERTENGFLSRADHGQNDDSDVLRGCSKIKVWVRVMSDGCKCALVEGGQANWHGLLKEVYMEFDVDGVVVRGVRHGWDCLLDEPEVETWVSTHEEKCSITVTGVVEFVRAGGNDSGW